MNSADLSNPKNGKTRLASSGDKEAATSNKDRILLAASQLLVDKGIDGLSVRAIAQTAGLSTIAIYSHFQGKEGVLDELYMEGFRRLKSAMDATITIEDPVEAAIAGTESYIEIARENEGHYRLMFGETGYAPSSNAQRAAWDAFASLVNQVARLLPDTNSRATQQRAAMRLWAMIHGYVSLRHHVIGSMLDYTQWHRMAMDSSSQAIRKIYEEGRAGEREV
ncbi:MAG: TetR/AcrR family transcriptional regulator [Pseudomonadota bacterium]